MMYISSGSLKPQTMTLPVVKMFTDTGLYSFSRSAGNNSGSYTQGTQRDILSRFTRNPISHFRVYGCNVIEGNEVEGDGRYENARKEASSSPMQPMVRNFPLLINMSVPLRSLTTSWKGLMHSLLSGRFL